MVGLVRSFPAVTISKAPSTDIFEEKTCRGIELLGTTEPDLSFLVFACHPPPAFSQVLRLVRDPSSV